MEVTYGSIARGFIHVHHVVPLSRRKRSYTVNPKLNLIPLCPNCHAVTHLADPPLSLELLKRKLTKTPDYALRRSGAAVTPVAELGVVGDSSRLP